LQCTNSGRHDKPEIHSVPHPPYRPDLAPSDFWLFPKLKETLKGQHFSSDAEVEAAVRKWFSSQPATFFMDGMIKWIEL
jgi:histone-lysine N-methyltransferase SETMAR